MRTMAGPSPRRFNVGEYYRMGELGILPETGVGPWDGEVVVKWGRRTASRTTITPG